jgi:hypothetical protein
MNQSGKVVAAQFDAHRLAAHRRGTPIVADTPGCEGRPRVDCVGQNAVVPESSLAPTPVHRRKLVIAICGWIALAAIYYLTLPIFGALSVFGWLVVLGCWIWALAASGIAVASLVRHRAYRWATAVVGLAIMAAIGIWNADWLTIYLKSQLWLHRSSLSELASAHRAGTLPVNASLPWQIKYLSLDGRVHRQTDTNSLYLPMWQNWRGEAGGGLVYLVQAPDKDTFIVTAPGGMGVPERYVGQGWWWVQGD